MELDFSKLQSIDVAKAIETMEKYVAPPQIDTRAFERLEIDPESTAHYQIKKQTEELREFAIQQITLLGEQNNQLKGNFEKLEQLYNLKVKELEDSKEDAKKVIDGLNGNYQKLHDLYSLKEKELEESKVEAKKAKKYNTTMLIIALVSAGIALASLVATILIAVL